MGSLWTGGAPEAYPDYEELLIDVDVRKATTTLYAAHAIAQGNNPLIPDSYYHIPSGVADGHVVFFPTVGAFRGLIIPCAEIFRFYYFGISGKLGVALLDGTYLTRPKELVSEVDCSWPDPITGNAYVRIGRCLDNDDRFEIARTTFDPVARSEAKNLVPLAATGSVHASFPLIIRPPFEGPTTLTLLGKRIRSGASWVFLAFVIKSCSAPMPFRHLGYNRQNPGNQGRPSATGTTPAYSGSYRNAIQADDEIAPKLTQATDPSSKDAPHKIDGILTRDRYTARFTDSLVDRGPITRTSMSVYTDTMATDALYASGTGAPGSPARAVSFAEAEERGLSPTFAAFKQMIALLPIVAPDLVIASVRDLAFPTSVDTRDPLGRAWAYVDSYGKSVPRRAIVATVILSNRYFSIIEIERRPKQPTQARQEYFRTAFLSPPFSVSITHSDERGILDNLIATRGVIGCIEWKSGHFGNWRCDGLKHYKETNKRRAARLFRALVNLHAS